MIIMEIKVPQKNKIKALSLLELYMIRKNYQLGQKNPLCPISFFKINVFQNIFKKEDILKIKDYLHKYKQVLAQ